MAKAYVKKFQKFEKINKSRMKGRVGHTRTGACPRKHGKRCMCAKRSIM